MTNVAIEKLISITARGIRYDGTNSAEIAPHLPPSAVTVSEEDGVWEVNEPDTYGTFIVRVGDYLLINGWFMPGDDVREHFRTLSLEVPQ